MTSRIRGEAGEALCMTRRHFRKAVPEIWFHTLAPHKSWRGWPTAEVSPWQSLPQADSGEPQKPQLKTDSHSKTLCPFFVRRASGGLQGSLQALLRLETA